MYDIIIIGGGPAGLTAALYASRAKLSTLLIEKTFIGGQMATTYEVENFPGIDTTLSGAEIATRMHNQALKFGANIIYDEVLDIGIDDIYKTVKTNTSVYRCKAMVLSMGAMPKELGFDKEKHFRGAGISYCATCDGAFYQNKKVAIVGGGNTAIEDAIFLTKFAEKVYLIHRRDSFRADKVLQQEVFANKKIEIIYNCEVIDILADTHISGLRLKDKKLGIEKTIEINGVFVAIGTTPNTELVKGKLELNKAGYIVTDETMQTNIFGVYAAGDVRDKPLWQIITAASDGAIAAYVAQKYIADNTW